MFNLKTIFQTTIEHGEIKITIFGLKLNANELIDIFHEIGTDNQGKIDDEKFINYVN